jgi:hypothetical protein
MPCVISLVGNHAIFIHTMSMYTAFHCLQPFNSSSHQFGEAISVLTAVYFKNSLGEIRTISVTIFLFFFFVLSTEYRPTFITLAQLIIDFIISVQFIRRKIGIKNG